MANCILVPVEKRICCDGGAASRLDEGKDSVKLQVKIYLHQNIKDAIYRYILKGLQDVKNGSDHKEELDFTSVLLEARDISWNDKKYGIESIIYLPCSVNISRSGNANIRNGAITDLVKEGIIRVITDNWAKNDQCDNFKVLDPKMVKYVTPDDQKQQQPSNSLLYIKEVVLDQNC